MKSDPQLQVRQWLRSEGYHVGKTQTGWSAVNARGVVITTGARRTKVELQGPDGILCVRIEDGKPVLYAVAEAINMVLMQAGSDARHEVPRNLEGETNAVHVALYKGEG